MTLLELLVQELPKRGGWPDGATCAAQDPDKLVMFATCDVRSVYRRIDGSWNLNASRLNGNGDEGYELADDHAKFIITREQYEAELAARKTGWNGNGLPPVGCECEFNACDIGWKKCTVMYASKYTVILHTVSDGDPEEEFTPEDLKFRPIRSEEDNKRDEAIAALKQFKPQLVGELAGYLYDDIAAGKIPHIRID